MPTINIGTMGFSLVFTATIPPDAQRVLQDRNESELAMFDLTPAWDTVPHLVVADLRRAGIDVPEHWAPTNHVHPLIHGSAFYIVPYIPQGMAASFSMKAVNIRTGLPEVDELTDQPCQSYWSQQVPWIDGYVPSHGEAVRQFVPLRGEKEMLMDVSDAVGVSHEHPWKDGISAAFYLPRDLMKLGNGRAYRDETTFEALIYGGAVKAARSADRTRGDVEEVGIAAGALMRQRHPDNPAVSAADFVEYPLIRLTVRLVWDDQWNKWAREAGEEVIAASRLRELESRQKQYESGLWAKIGGRPKTTRVDDLPTLTK